jgi:hypothetical protein
LEAIKGHLEAIKGHLEWRHSLLDEHG